MGEHTPKSWCIVWERREPDDCTFAICDGVEGDVGHSLVEGCAPVCATEAENEAVVALIDAAPQMLEALKAVTYALAIREGFNHRQAVELQNGRWADDAPRVVHEALEKARAAIAAGETGSWS